MVTQPRFGEKSFYVKLTFFLAKNITFDTKLLPYSESTSKIKLRSLGQFSKFCLCQQLFAFIMETRSSNISKSTKTTDFIETIPERSQKVLLETCNLIVPQRPVFLLEVLEFYATNNV